MEIKLPKTIDRKPWLRYMMGKGEPDDQLKEKMDEAEKLLLEAAQPRGIYRILGKEDVAMEGFSIAKHLEGCDQVAVLAVTIGNGIDHLVRIYELKNMAMAMILNAGASVLAEQAADEAEQAMIREIREKYGQKEAWKERDVFFTPRFSPGYGDYPLQYQNDILHYVDAARKIGITLTPGNMMVPVKSITGLVGIADHPVKGRLATCDECVLRSKCTLWSQGEHC